MEEHGTDHGITVDRILVAVALAGGLLFGTPMVHAQNAPRTSQTPPSPSQGRNAAPAHQTENTAGQKTFTGVIAHSGDQLVLTDPLTKTSYQLDDQRKAQEMVNKNVRVTGVLDPSTGTIRVSAIEPL